MKGGVGGSISLPNPHPPGIGSARVGQILERLGRILERLEAPQNPLKTPSYRHVLAIAGHAGFEPPKDGANEPNPKSTKKDNATRCRTFRDMRLPVSKTVVCVHGCLRLSWPATYEKNRTQTKNPQDNYFWNLRVSFLYECHWTNYWGLLGPTASPLGPIALQAVLKTTRRHMGPLVGERASDCQHANIAEMGSL